MDSSRIILKEGIEMYVKPHPNPHHAILNLEGGDEEVLHLRAFNKDLKIEIQVDEAKTGVVITTPSGMHRQAIPGRVQETEETKQ